MLTFCGTAPQRQEATKMLKDMHKEIVALKQRLVEQMITDKIDVNLQEDIASFFERNQLLLLDLLDDVLYKHLNNEDQ